MRIHKCDLHMHTEFSFDSSVAMEDYVRAALQRGVDAICFTDHIDCNKHYNTFADFRFEQRKRAFDEVKKRYDGQILLLLGYEVGEPHLHPDIMRRLRDCDTDMIIGSVHQPADYEAQTFDRRQYERLYDRYVREMVECGGFDVLGHADLPKKYHNDYVADEPFVFETMKICAERGIVPEINTSSLRNGVDATMPSMRAIEHYAQCGGKYVMINSDSHNAADLGSNFDRVCADLPRGVRLCYFERRILHPCDNCANIL